MKKSYTATANTIVSQLIAVPNACLLPLTTKQRDAFCWPDHLELNWKDWRFLLYVVFICGNFKNWPIGCQRKEKAAFISSLLLPKSANLYFLLKRWVECKGRVLGPVEINFGLVRSALIWGEMNLPALNKTLKQKQYNKYNRLWEKGTLVCVHCVSVKDFHHVLPVSDLQNNGSDLGGLDSTVNTLLRSVFLTMARRILQLSRFLVWKFRGPLWKTDRQSLDSRVFSNNIQRIVCEKD
jgi:hypothetical protein